MENPKFREGDEVKVVWSNEPGGSFIVGKVGFIGYVEPDGYVVDFWYDEEWADKSYFCKEDELELHVGLKGV